jgi:hypothetical protein
MAVGNTMMLLMKPSPAQGGKPLSFPHCVTKVGPSHTSGVLARQPEGRINRYCVLLRECIAGAHVTSAEAFLKPVRALLRAAVGEGFRIDVSGRFCFSRYKFIYLTTLPISASPPGLCELTSLTG